MTNVKTAEIHPSWQDFKQILHRWGVRAFAASFLEALGPLTILGAQAAYIGQPFLASLTSPDKFQEIIRLLEEPDRTKQFVSYLQEGEA
ncbi:MAG: hypothetical protein R3335_00645 [Anaerolineales bacterium]|nr:hypothetical protein [Anaerolineales bacterium]